MKLADLDKETRAVIFWAHIIAERSSALAMGKLRDALEAHDAKHRAEREDNLLRAIFDEEPV